MPTKKVPWLSWVWSISSFLSVFPSTVILHTAASPSGSTASPRWTTHWTGEISFPTVPLPCACAIKAISWDQVLVLTLHSSIYLCWRVGFHLGYRRIWQCEGCDPPHQLPSKAGWALPNGPVQGSFVGRVSPRLRSDIGSNFVLNCATVIVLTSWLLQLKRKRCLLTFWAVHN